MKIFKIFSLTFIICLLLAFNPDVFSQTNEYVESIEIADQYFNNKDYLNAKVSYEYAIRLNPDDSYPRKKLQETMLLLRDQMMLQEQYDLLIDEADELFNQEEFSKSILKYKEALELFPADQYADHKIEEANKLMILAEEQQDAFNQFLMLGEQNTDNGNLSEAIENYTDALGIYPGDIDIQQKISDLEAAIEQASKAEEFYENYLAEGNRLFDFKYYKNAREQYELAMEIKPDDPELKKRIAELEVLLLNQNEYDLLIEVADEFYMNQDFTNAAEKYNAALKIFPSEAYPTEMLYKISNADPVNNSQGDTFTQIVQKADQYFNQRNYEQAKIEYEKAILIKPDDSHVKKRISEIIRIFNEKDFIKEPYEEAIAEADHLYAQKEYQAAINAYRHAADMAPTEQYPLTQIKDIENYLENAVTIDKQYKTAIDNGDKYYAAKNYKLAKTFYNEALSYKSNEVYPQEKITEIDQILLLLDQKDKLYIKTIAKADSVLELTRYEEAVTLYTESLEIKPGESYPQQKIDEILELLQGFEEKRNQYNVLISEADDLFTNADYPLARNKYQEASVIYPEKTYPQEKILAIDQLLKDQADAIESSYMIAISDGDRLFDAGQLAAARGKYEEALSIKAIEQYPKNRIEEINHLLETEALKQKDYDQCIQLADQFFSEEKYQEALGKYNEALGILVSEEYPKQKIQEINTILQNEMNAKEFAYSNAVAEADQYFEEFEFESARSKYQLALSLKPAENYPQSKIEEIEVLIADHQRKQTEYSQMIREADELFVKENYNEAITKYEQALLVLPDESHPTQKIGEINKILQAAMDAKELSYNSAIASADDFLEKERWEESIIKYQEALSVKPDASYPLQKIAEVELLIAERERKTIAYTDAITEADQLFSQEMYLEARSKFQSASDIFPDEIYPLEKIEVINGILQAEADEKDRAYNLLLAQADDFFNNAKYTVAIEKYQEALLLKPDENYPQNQIATAEKAIADLVSKTGEYDSYISKGDDFYNEKSYRKAKQEYTMALAIFPDRDYPHKRINEIQRILEVEQQELQDRYNKVVKEADKFYNADSYGQAIDAYKRANKIIPEESYPLEMINAIQTYLSENAVRDLVLTPVSVDEKKQEKIPFQAVSVSDRKKSIIHLKVKNLSEEATKAVISYGSGTAKNGGFVLDLEPGEDELEFIIPVGTQYKWFTESNDWIGVYPEIGKLQILLLQISRGK